MDQATVDIVQAAVRDDYVKEIKTIISSKRTLYYLSNWAEYMAQVFIIISSISAFVGAYYKETALMILTGCSGVLSISMTRLSAYAKNEMLERSVTLSKSLATIGIENAPSIIVDSE